MNKVIGIFLLIGTFSCQKQDTYFVDSELQPFFTKFEEEARTRNIAINLESLNILGKMIAIDIKNVPGQCQYYKNETWVVIDPVYWNKMNINDKEALIFHELGHAALKREHFDGKGSRGTCLSLMHSSSGVCKSTYNQETQLFYLDELFK